MKRVDEKINEGEATFVRTSRFTVVSQKGIALRDLAFKVIINSLQVFKNKTNVLDISWK